ncbi:MAG: hypothetical protein ACUVRY_02800 [Thermoanaerobaculaceae bacterium]
MTILSFPPSNEWLRPQLHSGWWRGFLKALAYGGASALLLVSAAAPRQYRVKLSYQAAALRQEVANLEREIQALELEKSRLMAPTRLANALTSLNLVVPERKQLLYLSADGRLMTVSTPEGGRP